MPSAKDRRLAHALSTAPHALQRVDRFDNDIANIITNSAKRSGLTFAPEAGTQVCNSAAVRLALAVDRPCGARLFDFPFPCFSGSFTS